ncbi:MAG: hypothetical protein AABW88_01940 [Nanoarchaeota archaeon]
MKIAIDIDEVLSPFVPAMLKWHNQAYNRADKPTDFNSYIFEEHWGITREECIKRIKLFTSTPDFHQNIKPFEECFDVLNYLKQEHELYVLTSRQKELTDETKRWINKHFSSTFKDIYFSNELNPENISNTKGYLCREKGIELMIDDNYKFAIDCAERGIKVILLDRNGEYGWSKGELKPNIVRVQSWNEIYKEIKKK